MNAPMMLPYLAHKWDVSDARALELWRQACLDAKNVTGDTSSSLYWGEAKRRVIDLLDNEVIAHYPMTETPWIMIQMNLLRLLAGVNFWFKARQRQFPQFLSA